MMRRTIDILVAVCGLVLLSPVLVAIAILVWVDSPGSPLYGGWRVGQHGRRFRMWKFRTMVSGADRLGPAITAARDARVTRVGDTLRATKLDELPQLYNLLRGELTLVGPRAEVPELVARYTAEQREVLSVKPGITGPGQIHYTTDQAELLRDEVSAEDDYVAHLLGPKLRIDLDYVRRQTVGSDLAVLAKTFALLGRAFVAHPRKIRASRADLL